MRLGVVRAFGLAFGEGLAGWARVWEPCPWSWSCAAANGSGVSSIAASAAHGPFSCTFFQRRAPILAYEGSLMAIDRATIAPTDARRVGAGRDLPSIAGGQRALVRIII